ncbi:MAG: hypothetical protein RL235_224 [Chlamydiota bacterium]|jgi:hypothetical protein
MTTKEVSNSKSHYYFDIGNAEKLIKLGSAATIGPIRAIVNYIFPSLVPMTAGYRHLPKDDDPCHISHIPDAPRKAILKDVKALCELQGFRRNVHVYMSLGRDVTSVGGLYSLTTPVLAIPLHYIRRYEGSYFTEQKEGETLDCWRFSDDEVRFLLAREISALGYNNGLLRVAVKVLLATLFFFFFLTPVGWISGLTMFALSAIIYIVTERMFQSRIDGLAIDLLGRHMGDSDKATKTAISTLTKLRDQNIERRKINKLARLHITKSGNDLFDISHPRLTTRIKKAEAGLAQKLPALALAIA